MSNDIRVQYLGMTLDSPIVVGACPLTLDLEMVQGFVNAGVGAIVLPSILQEQLDFESMNTISLVEAIESSGYLPQHQRYNRGPEDYLTKIRDFKKRFAVPCIASISVASDGNWVDFAKKVAEAGADAIELNFQCIFSDRAESANTIEDRLCQIVRRVCATVSIPIAVKLSPHFTSVVSIAKKMDSAGAKGLVLFAHSPQWDVSIDRMHWTVRWVLSGENSLAGTLEGLVRANGAGLALSIAASGGIRTSEDALKAMIAGADVVMITSEIYRKGASAVQEISSGIQRYLATGHFPSLAAFQQRRPSAEDINARSMRLAYTDPLTCSNQYDDPILFKLR